jgi:hypothetical protein
MLEAKVRLRLSHERSMTTQVLYGLDQSRGCRIVWVKLDPLLVGIFCGDARASPRSAASSARVAWC